MILEDELLGWNMSSMLLEEWRAITKSSSKNEATGSKQNQCSPMDVSDGELKV